MLKERENEMIAQYIAENELEGFELVEEGIFVRTVTAGDEEEDPSKPGSNVTFDFQLFQLGDTDPTFDSYEGDNPSTISVGNSGLEFLNEALLDVHPDQKIEVLATSFASYEDAIQIFPSEIREDLFAKGEPIDLVRPFTPIYFKAEILKVQ